MTKSNEGVIQTEQMAVVEVSGSADSSAGARNGAAGASRSKKRDVQRSRNKSNIDAANSDSKATTDFEEPPKSKSNRPFPASTFEDSLEFARAVYNFGSGTKVRRLSLFDHLGKSPGSGPSRMMITSSGKYGLTTGGYTAEFLELTQEGQKAVNPESGPGEQLRVQIKLAVLDIEPFRWLYEEYKNKALPAQMVMKDFLESKGVAKEWLGECVDTFILNVKFLGLLKVLSGAERLVTMDHVLDEIQPARVSEPSVLSVKQSAGYGPVVVADSAVDYSTTCFYVSPIGEEESEHRRHSDLFLNHIVAPAVAQFSLNIVRADQIGSAGMITKQIIEHIVRAKLVIADLSYHNPNVFYELAIRHACRLPAVQIIRESDKIPFDVGQVRTVKVDDSSIYTLVPQLETYQSEIANQVRRALEEDTNAENPISLFFPGLDVKISG